MEHALINTIIASIVTAFAFGMVAKQLKLPAIFGYLLAGVAPETNRFAANAGVEQGYAQKFPGGGA